MNIGELRKVLKPLIANSQPEILADIIKEEMISGDVSKLVECLTKEPKSYAEYETGGPDYTSE